MTVDEAIKVIRNSGSGYAVVDILYELEIKRDAFLAGWERGYIRYQAHSPYSDQVQKDAEQDFEQFIKED